MKKLTYIIMFVLMATIVTAGWFEAQTPPPSPSSSTATENSTIMYINIENHLNDTIYYRLNSTGPIVENNYTIRVRPGRWWKYTGDLI